MPRAVRGQQDWASFGQDRATAVYCSLHCRYAKHTPRRTNDLGTRTRLYWHVGFYGDSDRGVARDPRHALDIGINLWDTATCTAATTNASSPPRCRRKDVFLATKFGNVRGPGGTYLGVNGHPDYVRTACDASLSRLGVERIDLYYQHRVDPKVPIEDTVGAMAELVRAGKVRHLGLSEASPTTLRRAAAVHPIAALQTEYSLWTRDVEAEILPTCRELGITLVAYSPLGRGFLTGQIRSLDDLAANDWRRSNPRFQGENLASNLKLAERIRELAAARRSTAAQLALAWLLGQGEDIVPIPGTRSRRRLDENAGAADLRLTVEETGAIASALPAVSGLRYPEASMRSVGI